MGFIGRGNGACTVLHPYQRADVCHDKVSGKLTHGKDAQSGRGGQGLAVSMQA